MVQAEILKKKKRGQHSSFVGTTGSPYHLEGDECCVVVMWVRMTAKVLTKQFVWTLLRLVMLYLLLENPTILVQIFCDFPWFHSHLQLQVCKIDSIWLRCLHVTSFVAMFRSHFHKASVPQSPKAPGHFDELFLSILTLAPWTMDHLNLQSLKLGHQTSSCRTSEKWYHHVIISEMSSLKSWHDRLWIILLHG